jgi:AAA family ATP:ADP antiporter
VSRLGVDIRRGEDLPALLLFLYFFLIIAFQYTTKALRQAEYIDELGAKWLPLVYLLVAVCTLPVLLIYSRSVDRVPRHQLIAVTSILVAGSLVGFFFLFRLETTWVPVVFYVWLSIVYVLNVSQFWSFSHHVFDPRQARRLFAFLGAGGLAGSVAGGQIAALTTSLVGTYASLFVAALLLIVAAVLVLVIQRLHPVAEPQTSDAAGMGDLEQARGGFQTILRSRHLQLVAAIMLMTVMVAQVVDIQFNEAVERSTTALDERSKFFGNFYSIMGIAALAFQLVLTSRILRLMGIGFATRVLPVSMGLGTVAIMATAVFAPALLLPAALVLKFSENGLRYSLDQATRELLFQPVPSAARVKAKAAIDVFVQRLGKGTAAILLLPVMFGLMTPIQAGWITLALIAVWLGVTVLMRIQYVQSFRDGLKRTTVDAALPVDLGDATSLELVIRSLDSDDPRQVIRSLELLQSSGKGHLVPRLMLSHSDPSVRARTLQLFAACQRKDAAKAVERLLTDEDVEVRVETVRTLATLQASDAESLMLPRLADNDERIRAAAISAVAGRGEEATRRAAESLTSLVDDERVEVRQVAAEVLGRIPDPIFEGPLVQLMLDADHRVARAAIGSARRRIERDGFNPIYTPILISSLRRRRLKHESREAIVSCGEQIVPALVHFQNDTEEQLWLRRAIPKTIARIKSPLAAQALIDCLEAGDHFLRRKAIEGLGWLRPEKSPALESAVRRQLFKEIGKQLRQVSDLHGIGLGVIARFEGPCVVWEDRPPTLLHHLLSDRIGLQLEMIFGLLALLHEPEAVWAAYAGLTGKDTARRSHALEYLDNALTPDERAKLFLVIGDDPHAQRRQRVHEHYGIEIESRIETLRRLITIQDSRDNASAWLAAAALHAAYCMEVTELRPQIEELGQDAPDPLVRETAQWVASRLHLPG